MNLGISFDKKKIKSLILDNHALLIECCKHNGNIDESSVDVSLLSSVETEQVVRLKIGVFFREVLACCACSDDPSQAITYENGYCELEAEFNKTTALISF